MRIVDAVYDEYAVIHTIKTKEGVSRVINKLYSKSDFNLEVKVLAKTCQKKNKQKNKKTALNLPWQGRSSIHQPISVSHKGFVSFPGINSAWKPW